MNIVVEGPDNSGKSTLIRHLVGALGIPLVPGEGPEKYPGEINDRVARYAKIDNAIFDRHPCVSQRIYNKFRVGTDVDYELTSDFYASKPIFVYCVGRDLDGQILKDYDKIVNASGVPHEKLVVDNHEAICALYRSWAERHATIIYRIGDGFDRIAIQLASLLNGNTSRFDPVADIEEFHTRFDLTYLDKPRVLPRELSDFRIRFMQEELDEYAQHDAAAWAQRELTVMGQRDDAEYAFHLENQLDALVDEVYVAIGTSYLHGFNFREAWRRVHAANMKKERCERVGDSKRGSTFDVIKPAGWEAPSHIDLVEDHNLRA